MLQVEVVTVVIVTVLFQRVAGMSDETIVISAFGRTITLGMLYDLRSDRILPGR